MFKIRKEQVAAIRKKKLGDGLVRTFEGTKQAATRDVTTEDVLIKDPAGDTIRCTFDDQGFIDRLIGPLGRTYRLENDSQGQLLGLTLPSGLHLGLTRDNDGRISNVSRGRQKLFDVAYDASTQRLGRFNFPDRTSWKFEYASPTHLASFTDRLGSTMRFDYDRDRKLSAITDGNNRQTRIHYNSRGLPSLVEYPHGGSESYGYDKAGRIGQIVFGNQKFVDIESDELNRPVRLTYGGGEEIRFTYNEKNNVIEATSPDAIVKYEYDGKGRLLKEDLGGQVVEYHYDDGDSLVGMTYPSGDKVAFSRDEELRLTSVTEWTGGRHQFRYAADESGYEHVFSSGVVARVQQNEMGQPLDVTVHNSGLGADELFSWRYRYDHEARLSTFTDSALGTQSFAYDVENQVLSVRAKYNTETFSYDLAGNRVASSGATAEFNAFNQMIRQGNLRYGFDDRGNLVNYEDGHTKWQFMYNRRNLLVAAQSAHGQRVLFGYDAFGRRIWKRSPELEIRYLWAGERLIGEVETRDGQTETRDYLYLPGTYIPLAMRVAGAVYYYHTDHLGSPRRLTDDRGQVVWSADYSAFGEARIVVERVRNPLRFPGQQFDDETGLHYNRFRYYSPLLGRYLSTDPLRYLGGLNFYTYADNNPIGACDPLGLLSLLGKIAVGCIAAGVGLLAVGLVVATGGAATPLVIIGAAALAGAVGGGLGSILDQKENCPTCPIDWGKAALAAGIGVVAGVVGAAAALTVAPAVMAVAGAGGIGLSGVGLGVATGVVTGAFGGAVGGATAYATGVALDPKAKWDWDKCAEAAFEGEVGGAVVGGILGGVLAEPAGPGPESPSENGAAPQTTPQARGGAIPREEPSPFGTHDGTSSGRPFNPDNAGGPIEPLTTDGVEINQAGADQVKQHTSRFGPDPANEVMQDRLQQIADGTLEPTQQDLNYYTHELREASRYKAMGYDNGVPADPETAHQLWNDTHTATLEDYGLKDGDLYHPSALGEE